MTRQAWIDIIHGIQVKTYGCNDTTERADQKDLAACLALEKEICKVVVFGSFLTSMTPSDLDVPIFQDSDEPCLPLQ
jgi:hypothetical protein